MAIWPQTQRPLAGGALRLGSDLAEDAHAHSYFQSMLLRIQLQQKKYDKHGVDGRQVQPTSVETALI